MPFIQVHTNTSTPDTTAMVKGLIALSASALEKSEALFAGTITSQPLVFRGSDEPCAVVEFTTLAGVTPDQNRTLVAGLCGTIAQEFGIELSRTWVVILEVEKDHWASGGQLISDR
ncbi:MAG: tautomerase family protein [Actinomycetia bacterium]|nr:tautomerase family protein [Actinomycetes bacterium]